MPLRVLCTGRHVRRLSGSLPFCDTVNIDFLSEIDLQFCYDSPMFGSPKFNVRCRAPPPTGCTEPGKARLGTGGVGRGADVSEIAAEYRVTLKFEMATKSTPGNRTPQHTHGAMEHCAVLPVHHQRTNQRKLVMFTCRFPSAGWRRRAGGRPLR